MKFTAVGDMMIQRQFPGEYEGFREVRDYIAKGDFRFANLETSVTDLDGVFASQYSGGTWLRTDPENLRYLDEYGFNAINCANNHMLDYSFKGLDNTIKSLKARGYTAAGIGYNMGEASAPVYLDTPKGRVALIGANVLYNAMPLTAGEQSRRVLGRPGVNTVRVSKTIIATHEQIEMIKQLGHDSLVNIGNEISRREGYIPDLPEGEAELDTLKFKEGEKPGVEYTVNKEDVARINRAIYEAQLQADYIFVSIHEHNSLERKDVPIDYSVELARQCIDHGAHGVIGHGPHLLRGVEIYKNRPIFHSLGDFILQIENVPVAPEDFFAKFGLTSDATVHELFDVRSHHFTRGLSAEKVMYETVIPYWEMENGELTALELMPVLLTYDVPRSRYGMPQIDKNAGILERLAELSKPFGTEIELVDGIGKVKVK